MAILSVEAPHASASPQKGKSHQRGRAASVTDKKAHPRPSSRPCPMPLQDMLPGLGGDFTKTSISPRTTPDEALSPLAPSPAKTPLTRKVHASAMSLPGVAQLHKLPLREFQEAEPVVLQRSGSNSSTPLPSTRRRSQSLSSLETSRPNSVRCTDLGTSSDGVRPLTRHERSQMNHDAVDWFRASQAINNRTRQDTEALLAAVRDRRNRVVKRCPKVQKVEDIEVESGNAEDNGEENVAVAAAPAEEQPRRKGCVDPAFLWNAKSVFTAKKEHEQNLKAPVVQRKRSHSICGEGIVAGQNPKSFLSRLRRQASTIE